MPAELAPKPWVLDYTPDGSGNPALPQQIVADADLTSDYPAELWDPPLLATMAATEFAGQYANWSEIDTDLTNAADPLWKRAMLWRTGLDPVAEIKSELNHLLALMADDRDRYAPEILAQADAAPLYWFQLLNLGGGEKPFTMALISYAQRVGEMVALDYKRWYQRPRPSALCPGLLVPFGPPRHPAFPSGHALTAHLTTGLLLRIDKLQHYKGEALLWLARRVATNRERAGLHYPSDSLAGERLATEVIERLFATGGNQIVNLEFINGSDGLFEKATDEWASAGPI